MDIYQALKSDHDAQRRLIEIIQKTHAGSEGRRDLFTRLHRELISHATTEDRVFYAALLAEPPTHDIVRHSVSEHEEIEEILDELAHRDPGEQGWMNRFHTLAERLEHHLREEESAVFRAAASVLSGPEAERLARSYAAMKSHEKSAVDAAPLSS